MGIDGKTLDLIKSTTRSYQGQRCLILGDCAFYLPGMTLQTFADICGFASVDTIDLFGNPTIRADLHDPIADSLRGKYGVVLDIGTICSCFDIAAVWRNALTLLADRGTIFHLAGLTGYFGRSYYSLHPALFRDFYAANGFDVTCMAVRARRASPDWRRRRRDNFSPIGIDDVFVTAADANGLTFEPELADHIPLLPNDAEIVCVANRTSRQPFSRAIPKYYANIEPLPMKKTA